MRKYIKKLILFSLIVCALIGLFVGARLIVSSQMDWKLPAEKTVAFMGASQITRDIDVENIKEGIQMSKPSERYIFTYLKLQKIAANNPQVKTVVLQCAPTDLWQNSDDKYFVDNEMSEFVPLFYPMFDTDVWKEYRGNYWRMTKFIVEHLFDYELYSQDAYLQRIAYGSQDNALLEGTMNRDEVKPKLEEGKYGNEVNTKFLRKIVSFCKNHNIKLILVYCPMFKPEYYYDQEYYYKRLEGLGEVTYLDYSRFEMADSLRYDAHHLNKHGAEVLTRQLCKDINLTYLK